MVGSTAGVKPAESLRCSFVDLGDSARMALMIVPVGRGSFREQATEAMSILRGILDRQSQRMIVTVQTVFLRDAGDQAECEAFLSLHYSGAAPVTNYVFQPPCSGAALGFEVWAIGGEGVRVERFGRHTLAVSYDSVRWVHCGGLQPAGTAGSYAQTKDALERMRRGLAQAGAGLENVVRTWFYLGGITEPEGEKERYQELNRARSDFYHDIQFCSALRRETQGPRIYPASTGIGMAGTGLVLSCLALETRRKDILLQPLENPQQTPAYSYGPQFSPQSPKFSRAMALVLGDYATTWVSGTASIVNAESCHRDDIERQTEQTIDNIERLIAAENFAAHGIPRAGASLHDMAKIRVYLKRPQDWLPCQAICRRRFGNVPAIYAVADVCRPELLVEIEGVAFSRLAGVPKPKA